MDMKASFLNLQTAMKAELAGISSATSHPGAVGDGAEEEWLKWLCKYLPKRYCVDKAFVVDCYGQSSHQIDLVIYDRQYTPFVFKKGSVLHIPAESVYAVFEVKQDLNKVHVEYAGEKAASVRRLHRTSTTIHTNIGPQSPKPHHEILAGILTTRVAWKPAYGEPFEKAVLGLNKEQRLQLGCSLESGSFRIEYDQQDQGHIEKSTEEEGLIYFFLKLVMDLQKIGTVPAIDIHQYALALDSVPGTPAGRT